jgi:hypothetical protein
MTTIAIHQPNFFPWIGYFEKIANCDYFVFLDDVQYSKGTMLNRAYINDKNTSNLLRLTCPVSYKHPAKINTVIISETKNWKDKTIKTILYNYPRKELLSDSISMLIRRKTSLLSTYNIQNIAEICSHLGIKPKKGFIIQSELGEFQNSKTDMLVDIIRCLNGDVYYSGTGAKSYMFDQHMENCGISVKFQDNKNFPAYSIIELLMTMDINDIKKRWLS